MSDRQNTPPPPPKWYQSNAFVLLSVVVFIIGSISIALYLLGIDPIIANFNIFKSAQTP